MKRILTLGILLFALFQGTVLAQINPKNDTIYSINIHRQTDFGLGFGLDYGGITGVKAIFSPIPHMGLFAAVGLQLGGIGWNLGAKGYLIPKMSNNAFRPYLKAMYGVNASTYVIDGPSKYNSTYTGATIGVGAEIRFGKKRKHGLNADLNMPFRSQEYEDTLEAMKNDPAIEIDVEPGTITFSIGYHWEF